MCGIAGFFDPGLRTPQPDQVLEKMAHAIAHRGPDGSGRWLDRERGVGFAHRRLAIIDLTDEGAQPMWSHCGRYVITFNGEIYNFEELRKELDAAAAVSWRGHSDTEVLLACLSRWGVSATLEKCNGMFAFALWDRQLQRLVLARDRFGEKPLYYGYGDGLLLFASELKALRAHPGMRRTLNPHALSQLFRFNYVPAPHCIWEGFYKLPPGSWVEIERRHVENRDLPEVHAFWSPSDCVAAVRSNGIRDISESEAVRLVDESLLRAVGLRMRADVPLGAFLSGGIDSSMIVAAMQAQSRTPVRTFSVAYDDKMFDEGVFARSVAEHLGTDHTELRLAPREALDTIPAMAGIFDEPFADASQVPTYLVSRLARRAVTVSLSGDAGDELFGGYNRHVWAPRLWQRIHRVPAALRTAGARAMTLLSPRTLDQLTGTLGHVAPVLRRHKGVGFKVHKAANVLVAESEWDLYERLCTFWNRPGTLVRGARDTQERLSGRQFMPRELSFRERMMIMDCKTYLPNDILVKVDRASMAVGLEARVPFLDPHLFEVAWSLPENMRVRGETGKWILRQVLHRYVPRELVERPKMGFGIPIDSWLRGELREWAEGLLAEPALRRSGLIEPAEVRAAWSRHLAGRGGMEHHLWSVLMFQAWYFNEFPA